MRRLLWLGLLASAFAQSPNGSIVLVGSNPNGKACTSGLPNQQYQGTLYTCKDGTWQEVGGGSASYPGVSSDGDNGLDVEGTVSTASAPSQQNLIVAWGDSLTEGYEGVIDRDDWPNLLNPLVGVPVINKGISGQTSTQIGVRQGGVSTNVTVSGGAIPACLRLPCNTGVTVTFPAGYEPVTSHGPYGGVAATIAGIHGLVSLASGVYTFTPDQLSPGATAGTVPFVVDTPYSNAFPVFWEGRNNYNNQTTIISDLTAQLALIPSTQGHLCLSIPNESLPSEAPATSPYTAILADNAAIESLCGEANYIDIRSILVNYNNASSQIPAIDASDKASDLPITSLHAVNGQGNLTQDINTTDTTFTWTGIVFQVGDILTADQEKMQITGWDAGTSTLTVTRGIGGTLASHTNGTQMMEYDPLHFSRQGYQVVAQSVAAKIPDATPWYKQVNTFSNYSAFVPNLVRYWGSNLAISPNATASTASGQNNVSIGQYAGAALSTGTGDLFIGSYAGYSATSQSNNNYFGIDSGEFSTGNYNVCNGAQTCRSATSTGNTVTGGLAGNNFTSGAYITLNGYQAGSANVTGNYLDAFGYQALTAATSGSNGAFGAFSLTNLVDGSNNVAVGYQSQRNNVSGVGNTSVGVNSLLNYTANGGTALGAQSCQNATSGNSLTCLGEYALYNITTGASDIGIGLAAGQYIADGTTANQTSGTSLYIGNGTKALANGDANEIVIGNQSVGNGSNTATLGNTGISNVYFPGSGTGSLATLRAANFLPPGTVTITPATGVTSATCTTTCTNTAGEITIQGNTATLGTIATVAFSSTLAAAPKVCMVTQNGGTTLFNVGHGTPSTVSFTITVGIQLLTNAVTVDYICEP